MWSFASPHFSVCVIGVFGHKFAKPGQCQSPCLFWGSGSFWRISTNHPFRGGEGVWRASPCGRVSEPSRRPLPPAPAGACPERRVPCWSRSPSAVPSPVRPGVVGELGGSLLVFEATSQVPRQAVVAAGGIRRGRWDPLQDTVFPLCLRSEFAAWKWKQQRNVLDPEAAWTQSGLEGKAFHTRFSRRGWEAGRPRVGGRRPLPRETGRWWGSGTTGPGTTQSR